MHPHFHARFPIFFSFFLSFRFLTMPRENSSFCMPYGIPVSGTCGNFASERGGGGGGGGSKVLVTVTSLFAGTGSMLLHLCDIVQSIHVFSPVPDLGLCVNGTRKKTRRQSADDIKRKLLGFFQSAGLSRVAVLFIRRTYRSLGPGSSVMRKLDLWGKYSLRLSSHLLRRTYSLHERRRGAYVPVDT